MPGEGWRRSWPGLPSTFSEAGNAVEAGVVEQALDFVRRNISIDASINHGGRRRERWDYPLEAVREAIVNAVAHRDYTIGVMDIELSIYSNRLEIVSPGRLPNTVTVDKMRAGYRTSRNELIKEVLRDYRYIEATGLGVPRKIVAGMRAHNGTEPDLVEEESALHRASLEAPPRRRRRESPGSRSVAAITNHERLDKALDLLETGPGPFVHREVHETRSTPVG